MMELLTLAMISSITVSAAKAAAHNTHTTAIRTADLFMLLFILKL
jgi:hypothetical protein